MSSVSENREEQLMRLQYQISFVGTDHVENRTSPIKSADWWISVYYLLLKRQSCSKHSDVTVTSLHFFRTPPSTQHVKTSRKNIVGLSGISVSLLRYLYIELENRKETKVKILISYSQQTLHIYVQLNLNFCSV